MTMEAAGLTEEVVTISSGDVVAVLLEQVYEPGDVERVDFEVDVDEARDPSGARGEAGLERTSAAPVALVEDVSAARGAGTDVTDQRSRIILAAIVDEHHLVLVPCLIEDLDERGGAGFQMRRFVVAGNHDGEVELHVVAALPVS